MKARIWRVCSDVPPLAVWSACNSRLESGVSASGTASGSAVPQAQQPSVEQLPHRGRRVPQQHYIQQLCGYGALAVKQRSRHVPGHNQVPNLL